MRLPRYTPKDVRHAVYCIDRYPFTRIKELFDGRKRLSIREMMELAIPAIDTIWMAYQFGLPLAILKAACAEFKIDPRYYWWFTDPIKREDYCGAIWDWCSESDRSGSSDSPRARRMRDYIYAQLCAAEGYTP
jgi:hypothetical protein